MFFSTFLILLGYMVHLSFSNCHESPNSPHRNGSAQFKPTLIKDLLPPLAGKRAGDFCSTGYNLTLPHYSMFHISLLVTGKAKMTFEPIQSSVIQMPFIKPILKCYSFLEKLKHFGKSALFKGTTLTKKTAFDSCQRLVTQQQPMLSESKCWLMLEAPNKNSLLLYYCFLFSP